MPLLYNTKHRCFLNSKQNLHLKNRVTLFSIYNLLFVACGYTHRNILSYSVDNIMMKNFSKNKLFHCFRPVVDIDSLLESKVAAHRSENKPQPHPKKRTLSKFITAAVLETILHRRALHKYRYGLDCFGELKNNYWTCKKQTKASQFSLSTLSSNSSSLSSPKVILQSENTSTKGNHEKESSSGSALLENQKKFEFRAMCLVVISLIFTVFWGKLFGIILTSICLYFFFLLNQTPAAKRCF